MIRSRVQEFLGKLVGRFKGLIAEIFPTEKFESQALMEMRLNPRFNTRQQFPAPPIFTVINVNPIDALTNQPVLNDSSDSTSNVISRLTLPSENLGSSGHPVSAPDTPSVTEPVTEPETEPEPVPADGGSYYPAPIL